MFRGVSGGWGSRRGGLVEVHGHGTIEMGFGAEQRGYGETATTVGPGGAEDDEAARVKKVTPDACQEVEDGVGIFALDQGVGRIDEGDLDGAGRRGEGGEGKRITGVDAGAIGEVEGSEVRGERGGHATIALHKEHGAGAAAEGFDAHGPNAGEEVEDVGIVEPAAQDIEHRLADAIGIGAAGFVAGGFELAAAERAGDDAHEEEVNEGKEDGSTQAGARE